MRYTLLCCWLILTTLVELSEETCEMLKKTFSFHGIEKTLYHYISCSEITPNDDINKIIFSTTNFSSEYLEILRSNLPELNKEMFVSLNLTQLIIEAGVDIIQEKTFERSNISTIILDNNGIRNIKDYAFKSFNINIVSLQNNNLTEIAAKTFAGSVNLRKLNLRMNTISTIEASAFKDLVNLVELNLSLNNIKNLISDTFEFLISLRDLNLNNNMLKEIDSNLFSKNRVLLYLNINNNSLTILEAGYFPKSLLELNADYNNINFLNISNLPKLNSASLSSNKLSKLTKCLNNLPALNSLRLNGNFLGKTTGDTSAFSLLTNLTLLELNNNNFKYFNFSGLKNIVTLENISLADNYLIKLDFSESPVNIKVLNVKQNYLNQLKNMSNLSILSQVDLSNNNLTEIDYELLEGLEKLQSLCVSHNFIEKFTLGCFKNLKSLKYLDVSYNRVTNITAGSLSGLDGLSDLDLSHNQLTYLNVDIFHNLKFLTTLSIAYNNLTDVNINGIIEHSHWLRNIDINGNNWNCKLLINFTKDNRFLEMKRGVFYNVSNIYGIPCSETTEIVKKPEDGFNDAAAGIYSISVKMSVIVALLILIIIFVSIKFVLSKYSSPVMTAKQFIYQKSESEPDVHLI